MSELHGYLLEFNEVEDLLKGARQVMDKGYRCVEAFTPFPVDELEDILPPEHNRIPLYTLCGGLAGGLLGYGIQYFSAVIDYPLLVGGKPMHAWPAYIPVTFELIVLGAVLAAFLATLWGNGLPQLHHPVFAAPDFDLASRDRFFLLIAAEDDKFDADATHAELRGLDASNIYPIELD